jgi:Flp pilus assembly protein TadD
MRFMSRPFIVCLLLALTTTLVYLPLRHHDFVNYDDPRLITDNPMVKAGLNWNGIRWAFTTTHTGNWHPITWISHMLDCEIFGIRPGAHHLVSAALHATNAVLLFLLLRSLTATLWPSALVAALFAWHPLRVQSVAWAAERKDVLSGFFALLALLAYARYAATRSTTQRRGSRSSGEPKRSGSRRLAYACSVILYALGLMAKPMLVTLPFVMLLLDYWPPKRLAAAQPAGRGRLGKGPNGGEKLAATGPSAESPRWRDMVFEKWPFFALSAVFCGIAMFAQAQSKALISLTNLPWKFRLYNAAMAYADYLLKTLYPANLAVFYPPPETISWTALGVVVVMLAIISWAVWRARQLSPHLLMGWLWFVGMLVPVIGLIQVGDQLDADRYTYLPCIGLFTAVVFGLAEIVASRHIKALVWGPVAVLTLVGCLWSTTLQLRYWQDGETLFAHAVSVTPNNTLALNNLGAILLQRGKTEEAVNRLTQAVELQPGNAWAQNNLGLALVKVGRFDEAELNYRKALELNPRYLKAHENLGGLYLQTGRLDAAISSFQAAMEIEPLDAKSFNDLGVAFMKSGRAEEGANSFRRAVGIEPNNARYRRNLGNALLRKGDVEEAKQYLAP